MVAETSDDDEVTQEARDIRDKLIIFYGMSFSIIIDIHLVCSVVSTLSSL